jgi:hypothetical protein
LAISQSEEEKNEVSAVTRARTTTAKNNFFMLQK